ncbi:MAG TPA: PQQ-dependent sugar dehydrogenase [Acidimicrobiia bacterium]
MRRALLTGLLVTVACTSSGEEPTPTPTTADSTTSTSSPAPTTTSAEATTTTTQPTTTTTTLAELQSLAYEEVAALDFPVEMTALPGSELSYIATKDGQVWAYDGSSLLEAPVLDISDQVRNDGEQGFLSIALHPEETDRFFAHYSDNNGDTVVSEFTFSSATKLDAASEQVLFTIDQPAANHNGGMIQFYQGELFLGLGDGGGGGDRFGNGQNTDTLLGGLVRLSVNDDSEPVLWQYGLRNPWRFWIDGDLIYTADVGQNAFEEVSVAATEEGINYGWPITEGLHCFSPASDCDMSGLTLPVVEVEHGDAGTCSITGGVVYRGQAIPEIDGHYFYSDYCGGYLRSFAYRAGEIVGEMDWTDQIGEAGRVAGFGIDGHGEMYVTTTEGLLKVVPDRGE